MTTLSAPIPSELLFQSGLPPGQVLTWIQLRSLAGEASYTPPLPVQVLASRIGKSSATLYCHLGGLRRTGLLDWFSGPSGLIVVFPASTSPVVQSPSPVSAQTPVEGQPVERPPEDEAGCEDQGGAENLPNPSLSLALHRIRVDSSLQESASLKLLIKNQELIDARERPKNRSSPPDSDPPESSPASVYREFARLTLNAVQRRVLAEQVQDLPRWRSTLEHWSAHRWNPRNLPGMLDLYRRGGASACRFCSKPAPTTALQAVEILRQRYSNPAAPDPPLTPPDPPGESRADQPAPSPPAGAKTDPAERLGPGSPAFDGPPPRAGLDQRPAAAIDQPPVDPPAHPP